MFTALCDYVRERMDEIGVPGAALGVLANGHVETAGLGVTSSEHPLEVDADTLFQIGSITKTFTGTAALRLVERGELDLDVPVRTYLPDLRLADPDVTERVTMRHLLTHLGGWVGDYFDDLGSGDDALARMVARMAELPQLTPLGEIWSYNNSGFYLAGRVIEVLAGKPFEASLQELVLEPLGLERTFFFADDVMTRRFVVGHVEDDDGATVVARPWGIGRAAHPAGGLVSTVGDLLVYARFHLGDGTAGSGERLLRAGSIEAMRVPHAELNESESMGLTWMLRTRGDTLTLGHGGGTNGQVSQLTLVPGAGFAVALVTNASRGGELVQDVIGRALRDYLDVDEPEPTPLALSDEELAEYAGRYAAEMLECELRPAEGALVGEITYKRGFPKRDSPPPPSPPPFPLAFYGDDLLFVPEGRYKGGRGRFLRHPDGGIAWLRIGGRIHARLD